jgi:hypothetical protein
MKTSTMLIVGLALGGAYLAYKAQTGGSKKMTVTGYGGASKTFPVDANMTDAEIQSTQTAWNQAAYASDQQAAQNLIGSLSAANHPMAAAALVGILNEAAAQQGQVAGYSAGAIRTLRPLPVIGHHLVQPHRLAMLGRI